MITLGKKGDLPAYRKANGFILKPSLVPKVFGEFSKRYANRSGGYTRIHKYGNRKGDNAPHAILELIDNPRDIRYEMTARSVGWDVLGKRVGETPGKDLINKGITGLEKLVEREWKGEAEENSGVLRQRTRRNLMKVLRYRGEEGVQDLARKAESHIVGEILPGHISECSYHPSGYTSNETTRRA
jgi:large subunit ribosomal protein L17